MVWQLVSRLIAWQNSELINELIDSEFEMWLLKHVLTEPCVLNILATNNLGVRFGFYA